MRNDTLSVVIPVRNGARTIGEQLSALTCQDFVGEWEVVVADNGSTDNTKDVVASFIPALPTLRLVDASSWPGASYARNFGARCADGGYLLFVDADDRVTSCWLSAMAAASSGSLAIGGSLQRFSASAGGEERVDGTIMEALPTLELRVPALCCGQRIAGWTPDFSGSSADSIHGIGQMKRSTSIGEHSSKATGLISFPTRPFSTGSETICGTPLASTFDTATTCLYCTVISEHEVLLEAHVARRSGRSLCCSSERADTGKPVATGDGGR